jgi:phosphate-selective porin OprO and OprP
MMKATKSVSRIGVLRILLWASAIAFSPSAHAQTVEKEAEPPADAPSPDDPSSLTVKPEEANQTAAEARVAVLEAQIAGLQGQLDDIKKSLTKAAPSWKGAPQWTDADEGWSFKPKGVIQFDAGYASLPANIGGTLGPVFGGFGATGVNTNNLGFGQRARRMIVGAEGSIPGGFGYKFELELSQGTVNYEDVVLTYQKSGSPLLVTVGYQYPLQSLEQLTSNRFTSFLERAGMTDAFGYGRRVGASLAFIDPNGQFTLTGGLYGEDIANTNVARTGWQASVRGTYSPFIANGQAHFGLNFQHRVQPRDAQNVRYRQRPYTQITDQRYVDTGRIAADGDDILGFEAAYVHKSFHFAGEAQKVWVRGYNDPTKVFGINNGTGGASAFLNSDPSFFSAYGEIGFFLTGETRGYKGGKWDRTKVLHPFNKDGWGAVQLNARLDYTNLQKPVGAGAITPGSLNYVNGGKQLGYEASLIWLPTDYVKFLAQYEHVNVTGGPAAAAARPLSTLPVSQRSYGTDVFALRAQLDF